jgi:hypothetical protein
MSLQVVHKRWLGIDLSKHKYSKIEEIAQYRLKIVTHFDLYGLASTLDAFCVSKRSLYRWRKKLIEAHGEWRVLIPKSTTPIKRNTRYVDYRILKFIQQERMKQVVGHRKLYHLFTHKASIFKNLHQAQLQTRTRNHRTRSRVL